MVPQVLPLDHRVGFSTSESEPTTHELALRRPAARDETHRAIPCAPGDPPILPGALKAPSVHTKVCRRANPADHEQRPGSSGKSPISGRRPRSGKQLGDPEPDRYIPRS